MLGAGLLPNGTPSLMLADRLDTGVNLYKLGKVKKLLLSGDPAQVKVMLQYALARGIPDPDIFTDFAGLDTYDTMYRAANVYQVKSALVVTQAFHVARAVYTARALRHSGCRDRLRHPTVRILRRQPRARCAIGWLG